MAKIKMAKSFPKQIIALKQPTERFIDFQRDANEWKFEELTQEERHRAYAEGWAIGVGEANVEKQRACPSCLEIGIRERHTKGFLLRTTQFEFWHAAVRYAAYIGPFGTGKTMLLCLRAFSLARMYPGTRLLLMRETYPQLKTTILATMFKMLTYFGFKEGTHYRHLVNAKEEDKAFVFPCRTRKGELVSSTILYRPVKNEGQTMEEAIADFQSLEVDWIGIDEAPLVQQRIYFVLQDRKNRWGKMTKENCVNPDLYRNWHPGLSITGNPPPDGHWIWEMYENKRWGVDQGNIPNPDEYWIAPIPTTYENKKNLSPDYIKDLEAKPQWYKNVYLLGQKGFIPPEGEPVYPNFNFDRFVSAQSLKYYPNRPLIIGLDCGTSDKWKAAVIFQLDPRGIVLTFAEIVTTSPGVGNFAKHIKMELQVRFPKIQQTRWFGDPAMFNKSQTDNKSAAMIFQEHGITVYPGETSDAVREDAVVQVMGRELDGSPSMLIDGAGCPILVQGFLGGYRYKIREELHGHYSKAKVKDKFSHPHNAFEYGCSRLAFVKANRDQAKDRAKIRSRNPHLFPQGDRSSGSTRGRPGMRH